MDKKGSKKRATKQSKLARTKPIADDVRTAVSGGAAGQLPPGHPNAVSIGFHGNVPDWYRKFYGGLTTASGIIVNAAPGPAGKIVNFINNARKHDKGPGFRGK